MNPPWSYTGLFCSAITRIKERNGSVPFALKLRWLNDVAAGLAYLHKKECVHKDIKAKNVLLDENLTAKLGDFELTTRGPDSTETREFGKKFPQAILAGTLTHMAPETILNYELLKEPHSSYDVYSFGIQAKNAMLF